MFVRRFGGIVTAIGILVVAAPRARAQGGVDASTKATARAVAEKALAQFDKGDFASALVGFQRADELVHAPTMSLMAARCLEKLGRLVEANERYRDAARAKIDDGASDAFKAAVDDADKEQKALLPRIPTLKITVRNAPPAEVEVTLDGATLPAAMLDLPRLTDPGHHVLLGKRGDVEVKREVDLKKGEPAEVTLDFKGDAAPAVEGTGSVQRALGWTGVGVGVAGLVFGGVTLGLGLSAKSTLTGSDGCTADLACPSSAPRSDVNHYDTLRPLPVVGFVAGGTALAAGVVLLLTAPRAKPAGAALTLRPWFGPGGGGVTGVF